MDGEILEEKCNLKGAATNGWIAMATDFLLPCCCAMTFKL